MTLGQAGEIRQLSIDPFADPVRAASEEFGDVLAEGLMDFLRRGIRAEEITEAEWAAAPIECATLLQGIAQRLCAKESSNDARIKAALRSCQVAEERLGHITAWTLRSYATGRRGVAGALIMAAAARLRGCRRGISELPPRGRISSFPADPGPTQARCPSSGGKLRAIQITA